MRVTTRSLRVIRPGIERVIDNTPPPDLAVSEHATQPEMVAITPEQWQALLKEDAWLL